MGLVTGIAGHAAGVLGRRHLRKVSRFRRVLLMAAAAQIGHVGQFGNVRLRVIGVLRQGTVAGFTSHMSMFARGPGFGRIVVTHDAGILPGEGYGVLADQVERAGPVVAILPECLGDDGVADYQKESHGGQQDQGGPNQMSGIAEQAAHQHPFFRAEFAPPRH